MAAEKVGDDQALADAVRDYATGVANTRKTFANDLADTVALHDTGVTARTKTFKNSVSTRQATRNDGVDGALATYDRAVADAARALTNSNAGIAYAESMGTITPEEAVIQRAAAAAAKDAAIATAEAARKNTIAGAESTRVNGNAVAFKSWVNDVGQKMVDLATTVKGKIDGLASSLKGAEDGLTGGVANAARGLASGLANAEATAQIASAQAGANFANGMSGVNGGNDINQTEGGNHERESKVQNRNNYENEIRQEHRNKMLAASAPDAGLQNLLVFQRSAAQTDLTWSVSKGLAVDAYELEVSAANTAAAVGMGGVVNLPAWEEVSQASTSSWDNDSGGSPGKSTKAPRKPAEGAGAVVQAGDASDLDPEPIWVGQPIKSTWWSGTKGFGWGLLQGVVNIGNGLTDSAIGIANLPAAGVNGISFLEESVGILNAEESHRLRIPYFSSPDWSKDLVIPEDETSHGISKFVGAAGVEILTGAWLAKLSKAKDAAKAAAALAAAEGTTAVEAEAAAVLAARAGGGAERGQRRVRHGFRGGCCRL
jgi:hypothetical protein